MFFKVVFRCFSGAPDLSDLSYALLKKINCTLKKSGHLCRSATTLRRRMRRSILFGHCIWESEGNQGRRSGGRPLVWEVGRAEGRCIGHKKRRSLVQRGRRQIQFC